MSKEINAKLDGLARQLKRVSTLGQLVIFIALVIGMIIVGLGVQVEIQRDLSEINSRLDSLADEVGVHCSVCDGPVDDTDPPMGDEVP